MVPKGVKGLLGCSQGWVRRYDCLSNFLKGFTDGLLTLFLGFLGVTNGVVKPFDTH